MPVPTPISPATPRAMLHDHLLTPRAERHADADLARPSRDGKGDDRVETDAGQHQTEAAEDAEQRGDPPSAAPATFSRFCAIVFAVTTGSVTSTARSSRCIAATRRSRITRRPRDDRRRRAPP